MDIFYFFVLPDVIPLVLMNEKNTKMLSGNIFGSASNYRID